MSITSEYNCEIKRKSQYYKPIEDIITNYNSIKERYKIFKEYNTFNKTILLNMVITSNNIGEVGETPVNEILELIDNYISQNLSANEDKKTISVIKLIVEGYNSVYICSKLKISEHTYCKCRFIAINRIATMYAFMQAGG
ncbi:hypothetical protein [Ruminococcus sp.]|uniref:hypothetical protein n=1 Tax=Ruminococcus sp. TaxID=41978 RepID=UPI00261F422E|nr:hypothetical protein [Ruminococcus sp.]MDD6989954.1 hypothetical protein [Ruminococcus sp.]MDY6201023.1 hypothetical protein [Ruminococcus sp.]